MHDSAVSSSNQSSHVHFQRNTLSTHSLQVEIWNQMTFLKLCQYACFLGFVTARICFAVAYQLLRMTFSARLYLICFPPRGLKSCAALQIKGQFRQIHCPCGSFRGPGGTDFIIH